MSVIAPETEAVLIVEDDSATAELERRALLRAGAKVCVVPNVREALDMLRRGTFSAILLDYQLPDGDAWQVVEAARNRIPRVPVIIVTAMGNERVAAEAIHRGVVEYVKKSDSFWDQLPGVVGRVSRLAHAEERLRRTDALFQLIADHASDMIATMTPEGLITYVSPACRKILGHEPAELIGTSSLALVHEEDREIARVALAASRAGQQRAVYRLRRRSGGHVWVEATTNVSRHPLGGVATEVIGVLRDVTDRKLAEDAIESEKARLAEALREREVLLQEVHHRVKNNLQVVSSLLNMQMRRLEPGQSRDALEACQTRVQVIALIHEKLYESKDYARVPLSGYAQSLARNVVRAMGVAPGAVELELELEEASLAMDKAIPCALILNELMTNALKHGFPQGRKGVLRVELRRLAGARLELVVSDNGVGMPGEQDPARPASMGTMLVRTLVQQLQGQLEVSSGAGKRGTRVRLSFPTGETSGA